MAHLIIIEGVNSGDLFVLGQLFAFGSIVLHANPTGHLDQINIFGPEHRIRFGNLEYVADARGDLVFAGFAASPCPPMGSYEPTPEPPPHLLYVSTSIPQQASSSDGSTQTGILESTSTMPVMHAKDLA